MSDMVVTLSGVVSVSDMEGHTAEQLISLALSHWNIPKESVEKPFVSLYHRASNKHKVIQGDETVTSLDPENDLVKVILPLKNVKVEQEDSRQFLVD